MMAASVGFRGVMIYAAVDDGAPAVFLG
jgi:hypothetical protein